MTQVVHTGGQCRDCRHHATSLYLVRDGSKMLCFYCAEKAEERINAENMARIKAWQATQRRES